LGKEGASSADPPGNPGEDPAAAADDSSPVARARQAVAGRSGADDKEEVLWEGGYSAKGMIGSWLLGLLATVALVVVAFLLMATGIFWMIPLALILLLWIWLGVAVMVRKLGVSYELTTQRFLHRVGVLSRKTDRIEVIDMDDVSFQQGLLQRMVGVGSIHIVSSDRSHPELTLHGIDDVENVADLIDQTRRAERRRRGLHIEAI
jgi:uncharacterized membrane protein YdbT with pleckstrin-like domain